MTWEHSVSLALFLMLVIGASGIWASELKADYLSWRQKRRALKAVTKPSRKGLRNHASYVLEAVLWSLVGVWVVIAACVPSTITIGTVLIILVLATFIRTRR